MDMALRRDIDKWLDTASDKQLQVKLLDLESKIDTVFTEQSVIEDAKAIARMIRAEIFTRPHAKHLRDNLPTED